MQIGFSFAGIALVSNLAIRGGVWLRARAHPLCLVIVIRIRITVECA